MEGHQGTELVEKALSLCKPAKRVPSVAKRIASKNAVRNNTLIQPLVHQLNWVDRTVKESEHAWNTAMTKRKKMSGTDGTGKFSALLQLISRNSMVILTLRRPGRNWNGEVPSSRSSSKLQNTCLWQGRSYLWPTARKGPANRFYVARLF